jgi:hypothetical protein
MASKGGAAGAFGRGVVSALLIIFALVAVMALMAVGTWLGYLVIQQVDNVIGVILGIAIFFVIGGVGVWLANRLEIDA